MQAKLQDLGLKNDPFWQELTCPNIRHPQAKTGALVAEDTIEDLDEE
jgi:hypothetical protein